MNKYKIFFRFRDKKLVIETEAKNKYDAESFVTNMLQIDEVRLIEGTEPTINSSNPFKDDQSIRDFLGIK